MNEIAGFFPLSGLVDAVIALTLIEGIALLAYRRLTGRGPAALDCIVNLLSGLCLMVALRCALGNAGWPWVVFWVAASGVAHAVDMKQRWTRA